MADVRYSISGLGSVVESELDKTLHLRLQGNDPPLTREHIVELVRQLSVAPNDPRTVTVLRRLLGLRVDSPLGTVFQEPAPPSAAPPAAPPAEPSSAPAVPISAAEGSPSPGEAPPVPSA